jgi:hypothetical protein
MAEHKIVLTLTGDIHAVPSSHETIIAQVGDTLRYDTNPPGLPFRVEIPDPFKKVPLLVIEDRKPRVLEAEGRFFWKCFMQRPRDKKFVGWFSGEKPESGGDVDVRPKS